MWVDRKRSDKLVAVGQERREQLTHARTLRRMLSFWRVQHSQLSVLFSAYYYQFWAFLPIHWQFTYMSTFTRQFICSQLPLFR